MQETRVLLRGAGRIDPVSAQEYAAQGGYDGLRKALGMTSAEVIKCVRASGLRGRGGAGFPTGLKWSFITREPVEKYIVCNADEGEPATNKDRVIFECVPHVVLEGMAIAGRAVNAHQGYIYLRMEYPHLHDLLARAIKNAYDAGYLGKDILGSGFDFDISLYTGAGAYVCGEETALIESIEGKRGEPRFKPPFPGVEGLWHRPTVVNNVETLANVPAILRDGPDAYTRLGTLKCPGTKLYTLCGNIYNPGVYEFPMGANLRTLFEEVGGGCPGGKKLLAVQTGGASAPIIRADDLDINMDIEGAQSKGAALGSGALMFIDDSNDILDVVENLMEFFTDESCGKCTPCREGNVRLLQIIRRIRQGLGRPEDICTLRDLSQTMTRASLCGLGQTSPTPIISTLQHFPEVYQQKVEGRRA